MLKNVSTPVGEGMQMTIGEYNVITNHLTLFFAYSSIHKAPVQSLGFTEEIPTIGERVKPKLIARIRYFKDDEIDKECVKVRLQDNDYDYLYDMDYKTYKKFKVKDGYRNIDLNSENIRRVR